MIVMSQEPSWNYRGNSSGETLGKHFVKNRKQILQAITKLQFQFNFLPACCLRCCCCFCCCCCIIGHATALATATTAKLVLEPT